MADTAVQQQPLRERVGERSRIKWEIWLVLGLSLGRSAVYSVIELIGRLTDDMPLAEQIADLNPVRSPRPYLDLTLQLYSIVFALVPVVLALYFLVIRPNAGTLSEAVGFNWRPRDLLWGIGLFAAVGIPGLLFYAVGRHLGITVAVQGSGLNAFWWTAPVLVLSAVKNGILEEVIVVGYLYRRTQDLGWSAGRRIDPRFLLLSASLRGSYHLYQGFGPFVANFVMGLLFAWWFQSRFSRYRIIPLIIAHTLIDIVAFVGYQLAPAGLLRLLGFAA
jgi:hypothetical protein